MSSNQVALLLFDLAFILVLAQGLGHLATRIGQPPVVGEILAGVLLGPTLLDGAVSDALFPQGIRPLLSAMADVGVTLFMFGVGLEIERQALRGRGRMAAVVTLGSTAVPFVLGTGLGFFLLRNHETDQKAAFIVFIGLAVSVTAFPVLARILSDRHLSSTTLGGIALASAALVDMVAWTALAGVQAAIGSGGAHWRVALMIPFILVLVLVVRPWLRHRTGGGDGRGPAPSWWYPLVLIGALLCGAATEAMGMHYIFGAFLFGLIMPSEGADRLRVDLMQRTRTVTAVLLPVYFVVAGLKVDLREFGWTRVTELAAVLLVAVLGKFGGTYLGARSTGLPPRAATALAALMNTRGLTELVILGVGLQAGLLDGGLYSLLVVMALVTTAMTGPLLTRTYAKPVTVPESAPEQPDRSSSVTPAA
ncbi:cation:proton antiporter [Streptomyces phaeoluteigriseus]|uniref:Cation:proton antiporter n=1 Tax=Streptomyces phaeoluteigriseus TaxID=114686 RepID=A0ABY4Z9I6_9ACTN|nr:cation:proton antiporter [Streptomyces phaeoluteigriseus]USQ85703.1 cation:proton antiporter [Streptomyces phaeoluteigriseus]